MVALDYSGVGDEEMWFWSIRVVMLDYIDVGHGRLWCWWTMVKMLEYSDGVYRPLACLEHGIGDGLNCC